MTNITPLYHPVTMIVGDPYLTDHISGAGVIVIIDRQPDDGLPEPVAAIEAQPPISKETSK